MKKLILKITQNPQKNTESDPYQFRRVKCGRFCNEYISTWSVIKKEFLKTFIKNCY